MLQKKKTRSIRAVGILNVLSVLTKPVRLKKSVSWRKWCRIRFIRVQYRRPSVVEEIILFWALLTKKPGKIGEFKPVNKIIRFANKQYHQLRQYRRRINVASWKNIATGSSVSQLDFQDERSNVAVWPSVLQINLKYKSLVCWVKRDVITLAFAPCKNRAVSFCGWIHVKWGQ